MQQSRDKDDAKKSHMGGIFRDVVAGLIVAGIIGLFTLLIQTKPIQKTPLTPPIPEGEQAGEAPAPQPPPLKHRTKPRPDEPVRIPEANRRLDELKSLVNEVRGDLTMPNVALVIDSTPSRSGLSPQMKLNRLFRDNTVNIIGNLFQENKFIRSGFFEEIFNGNTKLLKESGALKGIDFLLLGKLSYVFRKPGVLDKDLISCDMNFAYKIISHEAHIVRSDSLSETGAGFTEDAAVQSGLEKLAARYSSKPPEKG